MRILLIALTLHLLSQHPAVAQTVCRGVVQVRDFFGQIITDPSPIVSIRPYGSGLTRRVLVTPGQIFSSSCGRYEVEVSAEPYEKRIEIQELKSPTETEYIILALALKGPLPSDVATMRCESRSVDQRSTSTAIILKSAFGTYQRARNFRDSHRIVISDIPPGSYLLTVVNENGLLGSKNIDITSDDIDVRFELGRSRTINCQVSGTQDKP